MPGVELGSQIIEIWRRIGEHAPWPVFFAKFELPFLECAGGLRHHTLSLTYQKHHCRIFTLSHVRALL